MDHQHDDTNGAPGALTAVVDDARSGQRLDKALELLVPDSGLRLRRRLIDSGRVLVEGRPATPGLKVRPGQTLSLLPEARPSEPVAEVRVVRRTASYAALLKPAGLHSAAISGRSEPCVEALLPGMFPDARPVLMNRLDQLTSGLLLVALTPSAARDYQALDAMKIVKEYAAVVVGRLDGPLELKRALDTDDRRRTRVLGRLDPERRNWTLVWPEAELAPGHPAGLTLVRVQIFAGARHQIRAHLAAAYLPILGDPLYGEGGLPAARMYLHHRRMAFPRFEAEAPVDWPEPVVVG